MTDRQTDRQTDRRTGKNNMSPDPVGGRHNEIPLTITSGAIYVSNKKQPGLNWLNIFIFISIVQKDHGTYLLYTRMFALCGQTWWR